LADTIDFYHVYHNDIKIAEFNAFDLDDSSTVVTISNDNLKSGDQIIVKYFTDALTLDFTERIYAEDLNGNEIMEFKLNGRNHSIDLEELIEKSGLKTIAIKRQFTNHGKFNFVDTLFYFNLSD
jgi:hypothetical protein